VIAIALLAACGTPDDTDLTVVDLRRTEADVPAHPEPGDTWWGPEVTIEPYSEIMWCQFGTYHGDDVGIHEYTTYHAAQFNHHVIILGTTAPENEYPDGTLIDCTQTNSLPMGDFAPLFVASVDGSGNVAPALPDGMAAKLRDGQRYVIQDHFVNTSGDRLLMQDAINLGFMDPAVVENWAAPFIMNSSTFALPPQQPSTESFECTLEDDLTFLFINGHMHEWGTSLTVENLSTENTLYDVPVWDQSFRDLPPTDVFAPGDMVLPAGTTLRTTCNWDNDTDDTIEFPKEMCVGVAMVYPALTPIICDAP
jgi:hypothetical protein